MKIKAQKPIKFTIFNKIDYIFIIKTTMTFHFFTFLPFQ